MTDATQTLSDSEKFKFLEALHTFVYHEGRETSSEYGRPYRPSRGEVILMSGVFTCLRDAVPPSKYSPWLAYLDRYLANAFEAIRTEERFAQLRAEYRAQTEHDVPDLFEAHLGDSNSDRLHRLLVVSSLARLCGVLTGDVYVRPHLEAAFGAQSAVVAQAWYGFVRRAYREVMLRIAGESHRSNVGEFGETTLATFACAGRVVFQFSRLDGSHLQFVADDGDPTGVRSGPNVSVTRYDACVSMIEEVTRLWSLDAMVPKPI